jgi:hypothetical protein
MKNRIRVTRTITTIFELDKTDGAYEGMDFDLIVDEEEDHDVAIYDNTIGMDLEEIDGAKSLKMVLVEEI